MAEPEPEQTPTSSSEPISEFSAEPRPGYGAQIEPVPEWSTATVEWGIAWEIHLYGLGSMFILIAIQGIVSIVRLWCNDSRHKKVHMVNLSLLSIYGLSRALFLIIDGYRSKNVLSPIVVKVLWGVGQPCIITAYTLMFVVLKNALLMQQRFKAWYNTRNITLAALPYFMFVCIFEMTVAFIPSLKIFTFACQLLYVFFTLLLLFFYSIVARILWKKRSVKSGIDGSGPRTERRSRLQSILVVCLMAMLGGILLFVLQLYSMAGVYGVFSNVRAIAPWPWFIFNTSQRLLEVYMSVLLLWILSSNSQTTSTANSNQNTSTLNDVRNDDIVVHRHVNRKADFGPEMNGRNSELNFPGSMPLEPAYLQVH